MHRRIPSENRENDLFDYEQNYYRFFKTSSSDVEPRHKHLISQDDRFCYTPTAHTNQDISYLYFTCIFQNSMTASDFFALLLLCATMVLSLTGAYKELLVQIAASAPILSAPALGHARARYCSANHAASFCFSDFALNDGARRRRQQQRAHADFGCVCHVA